MVLYGKTKTYIREFIISTGIKKKLIQKKLFRHSFKAIQIKTLKHKTINLVKNEILLFRKTDNPKITNIDVERIIKPIKPDVLNKNVRIRETVISTVIPEEAPDTNVARNTGASDKSAFRKGNTGNIARLPINARTIEITENIELYTIAESLFLYSMETSIHIYKMNILYM